MELIRLLTRRPVLVLLGIFLIAVGGVASYRALPVDLFPSLDYPLINVVTHYPAGTSRDMELLVTRPIENAMAGLQQLRRVTSVSTPGFSQVTVEFDWGLNVLQARQLVLSALAQVAPSLPPGTTPQLENIGSSLAMVSTYTLSGGADPVTLRNWADYTLAPALTALPGVARVQVMGGGLQALRVDLDPQRLRAHHLAADAVVRGIRNANVLATGGFIQQYDRDLLVSTRAQIRSTDALEAVQIGRGADGAPLLLGDVARVYAGAVPVRYAITSDRTPAVAFIVQKQLGASTLAVSRAVDRELKTLVPPAGSHIRKFYDQAEIIGLAYRNMRDQLLIGALLSVLTLLFVLGRGRTTWIVAITIPLTVLGTFVLMHWAGLGINLMTLGALTVTIGMINDDAVLVLENIFRHRQLGKPPAHAAAEGVREILGADVAGTLTVLAAFVPLVLLTGIAGRMFLPFGVTFGAVLALSLVFSLTLIPWAAARWLPAASTGAAPPDTMGARWIQSVARVNARLLDRLLAHRALTIAASVALMLGALVLLAFNPTRFLPLLDENSLLLSYQLAPGTSLAESDRVGDELEALCLAQPGVQAVFRRTGSPTNTFFLEGPDAGELVLRLKPHSGLTADQIRAALERRLAPLPGILTRINEPTSEKIGESLSGLPALFGITVFGNDLAALHRAANRIEQAANRTPGLDNVINNTKVPVDTLQVRIDRGAAARLGVSPSAIADAVRVAIQGEDVSQSVVDGRLLRLYVRYAPSARRTPQDLEAVLVHGPHGALIPLGQLAHIVPAHSYPSIEHQFGKRALTITANIAGNPYAVMQRLDAAIRALRLAPDLRVAYTGEYRELIHTGGQMLIILAISALLVYGIMVIQLGNWLDPAVVLVKLPIDFMGAALALYLTRQTLDLTVMIGFVTLVGVAVNNGIVLLSFAGQLRREGLDAASAIHRAVEVRIRPLLLTHLTSILALVPAALGIGAGPQLLKALGVMLFGGLTTGAFLTLNLIPVLYVATERWRRPPRPAAELDGDPA